tara:strand:+ start:3862 stop:4263 length:402 start_codon:yes stop_codon:yes gene_type:complete
MNNLISECRASGLARNLFGAAVLCGGLSMSHPASSAACDTVVNGIRGAEIHLYHDEGLTQSAGTISRSKAREWRKVPLCVVRQKGGLIEVRYESGTAWGRNDELKIKGGELSAAPDSLGAQGVGANRGLGVKK